MSGREGNDWVIVLVMALAGMSAIAFIDFAEAHAQKPAEQPKNCFDVDGHKRPCVLLPGEGHAFWGKDIATGEHIIYEDGKELSRSPDMFGHPGLWIEQHCVAVLTEKHSVHHKLGEAAPSFDDRMEWDDAIPEHVLKLRCTPDKESQ